MPFVSSESLYECGKWIGTHTEDKVDCEKLCQTFKVTQSFLNPSKISGTQYPEVWRCLFIFENHPFKILMVQRKNRDPRGWDFDMQLSWGLFAKDSELPIQHWWDLCSAGSAPAGKDLCSAGSAPAGKDLDPRCLLSATVNINGDSGVSGLPVYDDADECADADANADAFEKIFDSPTIERRNLNDVSDDHYRLFKEFVTKSFILELESVPGVTINHQEEQ